MTFNHEQLYSAIVNALEKSPRSRENLISYVLDSIIVPNNEKILPIDKCFVTSDNIGTIINDMHAAGLIALDEKGKYYLIYSRPIMIRIEKCEKEIIMALVDGPKTKSEIREHLKTVFDTEKTVTTKDDSLLYNYMGHILKKFTSLGVLKFESNRYALSERLVNNFDNINQILTLRDDFLTRLHAAGGKFFEHYFISLLSKYYQKQNKVIIESYVSGGVDDSGIDGVIKTKDSLGFRETTMIQTKNRVQLTDETTVRGFYGALCAKGGTRGIFATTSDFYPSARAFLETLDNCIGICGNDIFNMAIKTSYGIIHSENSYKVDDAIFTKRKDK
jgi:hypothetical protein